MMGKTYQVIDESIRNWIAKQHMFFVGSAPLAEDGMVNLSPKGLDSLTVLDDSTLAYVDIGGSGIETIAHLRENGRIVIMFCAFEGPPKIFRFHGRGEVVVPTDKDFAELNALFDMPGIGTRAIIRVHVSRISDSCGYGVPNLSFVGDRRSMHNYLQNKGAEDVRDSQAVSSRQSIDGLPGLSEAEARSYVGASDEE